MKLAIIAAGRLREAWVREACEQYRLRIARHLPVEIIEVKDAAGLAARVPPRFRLVALDERGVQPTSRELADRLGRWMASGMPGVCFVLGGADGLPASLRERADEALSLSRLTLPHRLARVVLVEQLYRALAILHGDPYHRE